MTTSNVAKIFFDEELHKYTDEYGNTYTSTTTLIGKYANKFDVDNMARICARAGRKGNPKYKGKTEAMLKAEWKHLTKVACDEGSEKHSFLEDVIKSNTGYNIVGSNKYIKGRIHTVPEILRDPKYGRLTLEFFEQNGIKDRYPDIYKMLEILHNQGFAFYAELGVFNVRALVSGLIDLFAIKGNRFYIIDWKTNKAPIRYEAGYYIKDNYGNLTDEFKFTGQHLKKPLQYLEDSTGNKYALQLSTYAYQAEQFDINGENLICIGILLCHIRKDQHDPNKEHVKILVMPYLKDHVVAMFEDHCMHNKPKRQTKLYDLLLQN